MIKLVEILKLAEKQKWMRRFRAAYDGELLGWSDEQFGISVRFFVAIEGNKELGYIRIADKASFYKSFTAEEVWSICEAYVKPAFRNRGILWEMISQSVRDLNVKMLHIEPERFFAHRAYYFGLGFTYYYTVQNGFMLWAFQGSFRSTVEAMNDAYYQKAA